MYDITPKNADGMNIRVEANTSRPPIGELKFGEHARGDHISLFPNGDKWLQIDFPVLGWIAIVHNGELLSTVTEVGEPSPESPFVSAVLKRADGSTVEFDILPK